MRAESVWRCLGRARVWHLGAAACGIAFAVLAAQALTGALGSREVDLGNRSAKPGLRKFSGRGNHYAGRIPDKYRNNLAAQRAVVLEDGQPLPHKQTSIHSVDAGFGRYCIASKYAHFRPTDGGDPNTNGRRYTLHVPRMVKPRILWTVFAGGAACLFLAFRCPPATAPPPALARALEGWRARPWLESALVASVALLGALWALARYADLSNGGLCVMGMPYSDAIGWHQVAVFLREGLGFTAAYSDNRPFYPIFQAMVFLLTGDSVGAAQGTNVFLLAMGAFFVYAAARELFPWPVAVCALAFVVLAENHQKMAPVLLTELPAYAFGAAGVFLLARGCSPDPRSRRTWLLFLAGVFLGCSNLARPHTLLALPLCGFVILHSGLAGRWGWRPTFLRGCVFGFGIFLVLFPWCLREKRVHDVWGLSLNSSEMLYATASTKGGKWNAEEFAEAARDGYTQDDPAALHKYFGRRLAETVKADPAGYAATVRKGWIGFLRSLTIEKPVIHGILALAVLATLVAGSMAGRSVLPLLGFPLFWVLGSWADGWRGYELLPAAAIILLIAGGRRVRNGLLIAAVFLGGTGLLSAMVGNFGLRRGEPIIEWIFVMTVSAAALCLARLWCRLVAKPARDPVPVAPPLPGPVLLAHLLCGFMVIAGAGLVVLGATTEPSAMPGLTLDPKARGAAIAATRTRFPALAATEDALFFAEIVAVGDYRWEIAARRDCGHWSRLFERRNQSRSTAYVLTGARPHPGAGLYGAHFRGTLKGVEPKRPYVLVGLRNRDPHPPMEHDPLVIEGLALIPYDPETSALALDTARFFPPSREAEALSRAGIPR